MGLSRPSVALRHLLDIWRQCKLLCLLLAFLFFFCETVQANPDAKRLYDDLLSNYNRLIRPVSNNTDTVLVKLGLRLSQLIDLVSVICSDPSVCPSVPNPNCFRCSPNN